MPSKPTVAKFLRAVAILSLMIVGGILTTALNLVLLPFLAIFDRTYYVAHAITALLVKYLLLPFASVEVIGRENLNSVDGPGIMVCNHQSSLDAFIFGDLWDLDFRVTFKMELMLYPGVGTAMWLAGYIPITRGNKASGQAALKKCAYLLGKGVWILFFPEGTRKLDGSSGPLGPFKAGAFNLAVETQRPIVPITISGARDLMPSRGLPQLGWGKIKLIIHPPVASAGKGVTDLMEEVRTVIAKGLRPCDELERIVPKDAKSD